jgi:hypothetical protein
MNLRDFPAEVLGPFGIEAQHPDEFILHLLDLAPASVLAAAESHRQSLKNPPRTIEEYLETLEAAGARPVRVRATPTRNAIVSALGCRRRATDCQQVPPGMAQIRGLDGLSAR